MYDTVNPKKCACTTRTDCTKDDCDCEGFCGLYEWPLAELKTLTALTVSPRPENITSYEVLFEQWIDNFIKLLPTIEDCVIVLELAGLRPHFHGVFKVKDKVGFNIKTYNWSITDNVKKHNMFTQGLHYLFKDVDKTYHEVGFIPIITYEDLVATRLKQIENRRRRRVDIRTQQKESLQEFIPEWMIKGIE